MEIKKHKLKILRNICNRNIQVKFVRKNNTISSRHIRYYINLIIGVYPQETNQQTTDLLLNKDDKWSISPTNKSVMDKSTTNQSADDRRHIR